MTKNEALKLALEALEQLDGIDTETECVTIDVGDVMTAIKEALAQQCVCGEPDSAGTHRTEGPCLAPQPEPKCVAIVEVFGKDWRLDFMSLPVGKHKLYAQQYIYATPPQRKPLTDEEINALDYSGTRIEFVRAIEAAHGIKGEA